MFSLPKSTATSGTAELFHWKRQKLTVFRRVLSTLSTHVARRAKVIFRRELAGAVPGDSRSASFADDAAPSQRPRALRRLPPAAAAPLVRVALISTIADSCCVVDRTTDAKLGFQRQH